MSDKVYVKPHTRQTPTKISTDIYYKLSPSKWKVVHYETYNDLVDFLSSDERYLKEFAKMHNVSVEKVKTLIKEGKLNTLYKIEEPWQSDIQYEMQVMSKILSKVDKAVALVTYNFDTDEIWVIGLKKT